MWNGGIRRGSLERRLQTTVGLRVMRTCCRRVLKCIRWLRNKLAVSFIGRRLLRWLDAAVCHYGGSNLATKKYIADALFLSGSWASCYFACDHCSVFLNRVVIVANCHRYSVFMSRQMPSSRGLVAGDVISAMSSDHNSPSKIWWPRYRWVNFKGH